MKLAMLLTGWQPISSYLSCYIYIRRRHTYKEHYQGSSSIVILRSAKLDQLIALRSVKTNVKTIFFSVSKLNFVHKIYGNAYLDGSEHVSYMMCHSWIIFERPILLAFSVAHLR